MGKAREAYEVSCEKHGSRGHAGFSEGAGKTVFVDLPKGRKGKSGRNCFPCPLCKAEKSKSESQE